MGDAGTRLFNFFTGCRTERSARCCALTPPLLSAFSSLFLELFFCLSLRSASFAFKIGAYFAPSCLAPSPVTAHLAHGEQTVFLAPLSCICLQHLVRLQVPLRPLDKQVSPISLVPQRNWLFTPLPVATPTIPKRQRPNIKLKKRTFTPLKHNTYAALPRLSAGQQYVTGL